MSDKQTQERLIRIESRLVQIMLHLGMNPYQKMYDDNYPKKHDSDPSTFGLDPHGGGSSTGKP